MHQIKLRSSNVKSGPGLRIPPSTPTSKLSAIPRYSMKNASTPKTPTQEAISIDMDDVRKRIDSLVPYAGSYIKDLKGDTAENFRSLVRYVQVLHDTDVYKPFFDEVQKKMSPATSGRPLEPGTVGAYFTGCLSAPNVPEMNGQPAIEHCSAVCAGSMPVPSPPGDSILGYSGDFCKYTVVWATVDNGGYKFTTLCETPDKSRIIVYVDPGKGKTFSGFTDEEKATLAKYGATDVNIIRYVNAAGREGPFNIRHLLNGLIDSYLYHSGRVDTTLPFEELRRRSLINEAAQAADGAPDFSQRIRAALPPIPR